LFQYSMGFCFYGINHFKPLAAHRLRYDVAGGA
jgi:hypothetical protein